METHLEHSFDLIPQLNSFELKISESGIKSAEDILTLLNYGYNGFLIGTKFMKSTSPELECKKLIDLLTLNKQNQIS